MKYDTGMKHLHGDILAAVRLMLYHDTEITKKFSPSDGSPAPLREYIKEQYKDKGEGDRPDGEIRNCGRVLPYL